MKEFIKTFKPALIVAIIAIFMSLLVACNRTAVDLVYSYDYAYIELPTGEVVQGNVDSWKDYDDGDQLQVTINGVTYLTNSTRVVLVKK